jgi:ERCC4-related helicase
VRIRDEEWMVRSAKRGTSGGVALDVVGVSDLVRGVRAVFLSAHDKFELLRPEDTELVTDPSPRYRKSRLYLESLLRRTPPTDGRLWMGHRGALDLTGYQLVPAQQGLALPRARLLIADAVGLGKTIEAGILLSELIQRGRGQRILVVALKSVLEQIQLELWSRFAIPLVRLDSVGIERVRRRIPANMNPFHYFDRVIISIDTLKRNDQYRRYLEACHWDITLIDECQHVALRGTEKESSQRARLARLLARTTDSLLLTSATPHDGKRESFASLLRLLDPTAVPDVETFTKEDVSRYYVRRFKKDVAHEVSGAFQERQLITHHIPTSPAEDALYSELATATFETIDPRGRGKGILFRTLLLKGLLSSAEAFRSTVAERAKRLRGQAESPAREADLERLTKLEELAAPIALEKTPKFKKLVECLKAAGNERVVIFSERIQTLEALRPALASALKLKENQLEVFTGSQDDQEQQALVRAFATESSPIRLLLASDAASEGINLHHFCRRIIHYDLPWSLITLEQRNGRVDRYGQKHQPIIEYLLTRPGDERVRGDLRVLDVLVTKEKEASATLGDVAWLMRLHDPEAEAEHVAVAVSQHWTPEETFAPQDGDDLLADLLGLAMQPETPAVTAEPYRLYPDDLEYLKDAFEELKEDKANAVSPPEWAPKAQGVVLTPPDDLKRRYDFLPPELSRKDALIRLTSDRKRVMDSLSKARKAEGDWPEWELLWDQHPVLEWVHDRVAASLGRHEAPVLVARQGLPAESAAFVFQGVLSNERCQPILVDWFGVVLPTKNLPAVPPPQMRQSGLPGIGEDAAQKPSKGPDVKVDAIEVLPLATLAQRTNLGALSANAGSKFDRERLGLLRRPAVKLATDHMQALRLERRNKLMPELKAEQRRLNQWLERAEDALAARRSKTEAERKLRKHELERFESQARELAEVHKSYRDWIDRSLSVGDTPYLRLALVLIPDAPVTATQPSRKEKR